MKKIIVISGGSEGLGKAMAKRLSPDSQVVILAKSEDTLKQTAQELNCDYLVCDVSDYNQVESTINQITEKYKQIDCLINNAGIWTTGELQSNDYKNIEEVMAVNANGTIYLTKAVIPAMKKQKQGLIINIVSQAGVTAKKDRSVYYASKWAVTGFTHSMQLELAPFGIKVTGIYPGKMDTQLFAKAGDNKPMDNALKPEQVADLVNYILNTPPEFMFLDIGMKNIND